MSTCILVGALVITADIAAWIITAETGDNRWVVLITAGSGVIIAFCATVVMVAPHVGRAITALGASILPALAAIRKQNEELNKGTLSDQIKTLGEQNEKLQKTVEEDRSRTEDANRKLHQIRDEFNTATLAHHEQRETLIAEVARLTESLAEARQEIAEFQRMEAARLNAMAAGQVRQDVKIDENKVAIEKLKASTSNPEIEVFRPPTEEPPP